jgi:hypothetical protein
MIVWVVISIVFSAVTVTAAVDPLPRKVVLSADNLEILRLDIMAMEVRLSKNMKEQSDRVVAALDRHGVKLEESGADLCRANIAMAAALERQAVRMDMFEGILDRLINATLFQVDVRPVIHGFETVVRSARLDARAAADAAREAVVAANATREDVKEAVAAAPSVKTAPAPGWDDWEYWWKWWQASWHTPLSAFFLGFSLYQAESRIHTTLFFVLGIFFSPYLARCGHAVRVGPVYCHLVPFYQTLGPTYAMRSLLLSSFGRRLGEGRGTGRSRASPSGRRPGGGSQGSLHLEWLGPGDDYRTSWVLGLCSRVDGSGFPVLPPQYPKQLFHVVCVGSSCKNMVEAASNSSKCMVM